LSRKQNMVRISDMTKFIIKNAAAELGKTQQQVVDDLVSATFPAHKKTYEAIKKKQGN